MVIFLVYQRFFSSFFWNLVIFLFQHVLKSIKVPKKVALIQIDTKQSSKKNVCHQLPFLYHICLPPYRTVAKCHKTKPRRDGSRLPLVTISCFNFEKMIFETFFFLFSGFQSIQVECKYVCLFVCVCGLWSERLCTSVAKFIDTKQNYSHAFASNSHTQIWNTAKKNTKESPFLVGCYCKTLRCDSNIPYDNIWLVATWWYEYGFVNKLWKNGHKNAHSNSHLFCIYFVCLLHNRTWKVERQWFTYSITTV